MHSSESAEPAGHLQPVFLNVPRRAVMGLLGGVAIGLALACGAAALDEQGLRRFQLAWLVAFAFVASLSLGSLFFVILQHLTRAGWSVLVRRPAEVFAMNIVSVAILALPIAWFVQRGELYPWAAASPVNDANHEGSGHHPAPPVEAASLDHEAGTGTAAGHRDTAGPVVDHFATLYIHQVPDELTRSKGAWLNRRGFLIRMAVWLGAWILLAAWFFIHSRRMEAGTEAVAETRRLEWSSGPAMLAFGLTLTFASFDWLMSIDPHWYSTMFGVYFFAGCAVGGFALILLSVILLERSGAIPGVLSVEHRRDLGRFLFAFVFFWGYIAFSQYLLLWYANVPETTRWFVVRGASQATGYANAWGWLLLVLLFGHFLIPFAAIMSRHVKASPRAMLFWTVWLLAMHWLDLVWLVMPELGPRLTIGAVELGTLLAVTSGWLLGASWIATRTPLLPVGDPRLAESLRITAAY